MKTDEEEKNNLRMFNFSSVMMKRYQGEGIQFN